MHPMDKGKGVGVVHVMTDPMTLVHSTTVLVLVLSLVAVGAGVGAGASTSIVSTAVEEKVAWALALGGGGGGGRSSAPPPPLSSLDLLRYQPLLLLMQQTM